MTLRIDDTGYDPWDAIDRALDIIKTALAGIGVFTMFMAICIFAGYLS